ncbi:MAG: Hypothetical protein AJITA_00109 [Acetilactobacillus jinshanensis]
MGRATFYRLFDSKADVLAYQCDQISKKATVKSLFLNCAQLCLKNHHLFETIIESHQAQIIYRALMKRLNLINVSDQQMDYFLSDLTHLIIGTLSTWIRHGEKETARELIRNAATTVGIIYRSIK